MKAKVNNVAVDNEHVYAKLDWFTMMFKDCDFISILEWLDLDSYVDEFVKSFVARSCGYDDQFIFGFNGVTVSTRQFGFFGSDDADEDWFYKIFPKVRLDISGSGLDFLRSRGLDVDTYLRDVTKLPFDPERCYCTRCDFAFDLINYKPEFIDQLIDYCKNNATANNRLCVYQSSGPLTFEVKTGSQKTVYVGSKNAQQMLRVYDKKMQYYDYGANVYKKENPYGNPDSWIRIELQTRRDKAGHLCFGDGDFNTILRHIHDDYNFADVANTTKQNRRPAAFWAMLFDWEKLAHIVEKAYFVQFAKSPVQVVADSFDRNWLNFALAYSAFGPKWLERRINEILSKIQLRDTPSDKRRADRVLARVKCLDNYDTVNAKHGLYSDGSMLRFKL